jgi:hypothetical protein
MSRYDRLISQLYSDPADAALAKRFVAQFEHEPMMDGRLEALLREAARPNADVAGGSMTPDQAWSYLRDFAQQIGTPPHVMTAFDGWLDTTAAELAAETPPETEQPADPALAQPAAKPAPPAPAPAAAALPATGGPTRAQLQEKIAAHQRDMNSAPGSEGWTRYWRGGGGADYLDALRAMESVDAAPAAPLAGGAVAPASAAAEPAQPGTGQL